MFEVKGDRPQWMVIYERLADMQIGDVIKDDELAGLLPDAPEGSVRSAFYRAVKETEDELRRTFCRVRTTGYRMVDANEHERLARDQHKRARRRLTAARRKAHSADRSRLTPDERRRLDAVELNLAQMQDMTKRLDRGLKSERIERKAGEAATNERIDELVSLLQRHGITADDEAKAAS